MFILFSVGLGFVLGIFKLTTISAVIQLALVVPTLAIGVRRFHDSGHSGKLLLSLIAVATVSMMAFIVITFSFGAIQVPDSVFIILPLIYIATSLCILYFLVKPTQTTVNSYGAPAVPKTGPEGTTPVVAIDAPVSMTESMDVTSDVPASSDGSSDQK